ncbi:hypothetical protein [Deinococcus marmoris]|uniref:Uncharacterized protein n=1 Tax=Deinococcus marmoris TaxID=249408 RepID=A0A1U7NYN1_9DEIO|nr:hypothetical protein [Deinococcus marmoris]OLV18014.1 hypothetical protein BOO71_0007099 [Deinococcus marmoris]
MTAPETPFAPGQRWAYRTRPGKAASTLLILRGGGDTWHITVDGLHLKNPYTAGGVQTDLPHSPISAGALRASVSALLEEGATLPEDQSGYEQWRGAHERGEAGVFTLEVAQIVTALEEAVNTPRPSEGNPLFQKNKLK